MLITNEYQTASEEVNDQINELNQIGLLLSGRQNQFYERVIP
jgi:hypothetical protein